MTQPHWSERRDDPTALVDPVEEAAMFKAARDYDGLMAVLEGYKAGELDLDSVRTPDGWQITTTWRFPEGQPPI